MPGFIFGSTELFFREVGLYICIHFTFWGRLESTGSVDDMLACQVVSVHL